MTLAAKHLAHEMHLHQKHVLFFIRYFSFLMQLECDISSVCCRLLRGPLPHRGCPGGAEGEGEGEGGGDEVEGGGGWRTSTAGWQRAGQ